MEHKLGNWVIFPRKIASDFRNRIITLDEMSVHNWLRLNANPYGIATTSFSDISKDLFRGRKKENYINKILLSLKRKKYVYYQKRTGSRGSFEVHFGDFLLPTRTVRKLDGFFQSEEVRTTDTAETVKITEPEQNLPTNSQNLDSIKKQIKSIVYGSSTKNEIRGSNNENENKKEKEINTEADSPFKKKPEPPYYDMATKRIIEK